MPKMDGFELLTHMNNEYPAIPVIVISAFATPDIKNKVGNLGAILFIPKPFTYEDLDAIDFDKIFHEEVKKNGSKGHIHGISLQSFLQLINIESKTCTLTVQSGGKSGVIFIKNGDLMNAKSGHLIGNKAAREIITWNSDGLTIEIENNCSENEKNITYTIMSLLMESARIEDERSAKEAGIVDEDKEEAKKVKEATAAAQTQPSPPPAEAASAPEPAPAPEPLPFWAEEEPVAKTKAPSGPESKYNTVDLHKLDLVKIQAMFKEFASLDGFSGAVLSTSAGDILQIVSTESSNINLEQAAIFANSILATSYNSTTKMKIEGDIEMVQVDTKAGHMLISGKSGINIMLILATTNSLGLGKIMASRTLVEIMKNIQK
jgi:CheY-like chemotaxis protein